MRRTRIALRRHARMSLLLALVAALLATLAPAASAASPEERRLAETRAKLAEVRAELAAEQERRTTQAERLEQAEARLERVREAVEQAEQAVQRQQEAVDAARAELADLTEQVDVQREVMRRRAVDLYKQGTGVPLEAILASGTPKEALERSAAVDVVTRADRRSIEGLDAAQTAVDAQRLVLEEEERALAAVLDEQQLLFAEVDELRNERALAVASTDESIAQLEGQERHLERESREVAALARRAAQTAARAERAERAERADRAERSSQQAEQPSEAVPAAAPAEPARSGGGGWVWPANGPVTSEYGPRWGRMHEGLDIGDPTGAPIFAASSGTVSYVGSMSGYGNMTLIDHGGGIVTAYAHQSAFGVTVGQSVSAGQRIGSVGCTGSCTGPHLHFEIRVNGNAVNPRRYLP